MQSASAVIRLIYFTASNFIGGGLYFYFNTLFFNTICSV